MTQAAPNPQEAPQKQPDSQNSEPKSEGNDKAPLKTKKFNPRLAIPLGLAIGAIGYSIWTIVPKPPETILHVSGRLESDETDIGAKTSGRVVIPFSNLNIAIALIHKADIYIAAS
ncbi:hypothetical protein TUMEXPCC7403_24810 [Tumidithrix helvetica PCC 7403]|uniref:hypothetical protein n=1 Tax=Tumidithrix helvetica TaxID=3457545 RepID=UPI003CA9BB30